MGKIEKCEDVLNGVKVNWAGYEPPGGETWRKLFVEAGVYLRQLRKDYSKNGISALAALEKPAVPSRSIPESPVKDSGAIDSAAAG